MRQQYHGQIKKSQMFFTNPQHKNVNIANIVFVLSLSSKYSKKNHLTLKCNSHVPPLISYLLASIGEKSKCTTWALNPYPPNHHSNTLPTGLSQYLVFFLNY